MNTDELKIKFTTKKEEISKPIFCWPTLNDESLVTEVAILRVLPEPDLGRRGDLIFPVQFNSFNKQ